MEFSGIQKRVIRQHFVSAGYLARFTLNGERDSMFYVFSPEGKRMREGVPNSVGFERHYHDIDVPGVPPDILEEFFIKFEGPACALFRTLSANPGRLLQSLQEREIVSSFLALQAARVPQSKQRHEQLLCDGRNAFANEMASSPESFNKAMAIAERHGVVADSADRSRLLEALQGGHVVPQVHKTEASIGILRLALAIADQLDGMHYSLLYSDGSEWFVCSDYPVGLFYTFKVPTDPFHAECNAEWPELHPFDRTIYMPLAYNVAIAIHRSENRPTVMQADRQMVAIVNGITVAFSQRFICSPTPDFICALPGGKLGNAIDTIEVLEKFKESE